MLIAYLFLAPGILEQVEQEFQKNMAFARYPQSHWKEVAQAVQRVRSDGQLMDRLRRLAKAEASKPANSDSGGPDDLPQ